MNRPHEKRLASDPERIKLLAPVIAASALEKWFGGLDIAEEELVGLRVVRDQAAARLGTVSRTRQSGPYFNTVSLQFLPDSGEPQVTVRGRYLGSYSRASEPIRDLDFLGKTDQSHIPEWRKRAGSVQELVVPGTRVGVLSTPGIAQVAAENALSAAQAEEALLGLGGILLEAATAPQQANRTD